MPHVIEQATTGRAQCRTCGKKIEKGEWRFGEKRDNAFGEGESTLWFHPLCAAYSRPEQLLELTVTETIQDAERLQPIAAAGVANPRLTRVGAASRAPTARASCRHCHEAIDKNAWRIGLVFFEEFRFNAGGYIHAKCAGPYFETTDVLERVRHFSPELTSEELAEIQAVIDAGSPSSTSTV
jgi:hypothetical protein